jgi:hypothetical protein
MESKGFFKGINFNKTWAEADWEKFFQAQDAYRLSVQAKEIRKKPVPRIKFNGRDEVEAFDPVLKEYVQTNLPPILPQLHSPKFVGDENPEADYYPSIDDGDTHFWTEGAPLKTVVIYRDACRFAICVAQEIDKFLKRKTPAFRKKENAQFELLRFHAYWAAINVAEGHRIGYSPDRIRGNIAKCQRAVKHADAAIGLITRISKVTRAAMFRRELFAFAFQLRNALYEWSDELRYRF